MAIDTKLITKLRELTGAGMVDCKAALKEADNDIDKAVEILRKKGVMKAAKKLDRTTKEGVIAITQEGNKAAIVGLACETDFVARNDDFIKTVEEFTQKLLETGEDEFRSWAEARIKNELIVKIGENIQLAFFKVIEGEAIGTYLHSNKKIAAAVILSQEDKELAVDLAMQVAAMSPKYLKPEDVLAEELEKEKEIYREQLKDEGKPENVLDKIIEGKLSKYYQEVCLLKQPFIKDDKINIEELINEKVEVIEFIRYQI